MKQGVLSMIEGSNEKFWWMNEVGKYQTSIFLHLRFLGVHIEKKFAAQNKKFFNIYKR